MKKTARKRTPKKETIATIAARHAKKPPKRKPVPSDKTRAARRKKTSGDISLALATFKAISARARVESTAAGYSISTSKLVERIMTEYLDGLEGARGLTPEDESRAAKIVVGGFVVKDRGVEGPFVHVDSKGHVTRAGFPGSKLAVLSAAQTHERTGETRKLRGEEATRSHNVADGPIVQRFENSAFDPTPADSDEVADDEPPPDIEDDVAKLQSGEDPDAEDSEFGERDA